MDPLTIGLLGGSIATGLASPFVSWFTNKSNQRAQNAANWQNYYAQKEFAQNSIKWRKDDAIRSGINPIYALGAGSANFSPAFQASQGTAPDLAYLSGTLGQTAIARQQLAEQRQLNDAQVGLLQAQTHLALTQADSLSSNNSGTSSILDPTAGASSTTVSPSGVNGSSSGKRLSEVKQGDFGNALYKNKHFFIQDYGRDTISIQPTSSTKRDNQTEIIDFLGSLAHWINGSTYPVPKTVVFDGKTYEYSAFKTWLNKELQYVEKSNDNLTWRDIIQSAIRFSNKIWDRKWKNK